MPVLFYRHKRRNVTAKATGLVRKIDDLGRVVIPAEIRRIMGIGEKNPIEIYIEFDKIILKKYEQTCTFCGTSEDLRSYQGKIVCKKCTEEVYKNIQTV